MSLPSQCSLRRSLCQRPVMTQPFRRETPSFCVYSSVCFLSWNNQNRILRSHLYRKNNPASKSSSKRQQRSRVRLFLAILVLTMRKKITRNTLTPRADCPRFPLRNSEICRYRIQGLQVTEYWSHLSAGKNPTPQESEARAKQIAQLSGVKDTSLMRVICEAGVPVEIQVNGAAVRIDPTLFSDIELSRINGENTSTQNALQKVRDSLNEPTPLKGESRLGNQPFSSSHADDF